MGTYEVDSDGFHNLSILSFFFLIFVLFLFTFLLSLKSFQSLKQYLLTRLELNL